MSADPMSHQELQELLGAYALDAVDPAEAAALEAHVPTCPRCSAELAAHREVTSLFAYRGQEAPDGLWDRIASRMQEGPPELRLDRIRPRMVTPTEAIAAGQALGVSPESDLASPGRGRRARPMSARLLRWRWVAPVAAAVAVAVAVLGVEVAHLSSSPATASASGGPTMTQVRHALAEPGSRTVTLTGAGGARTTMEAVITAGGVGYVYGEEHVAALPADRTYQLWGVVGHRAISYGLLGSDPHIVEFAAGRSVSTLAVSDEVASGVVVSHNNAVLVGSVRPGV
jgi:anti-sigma factor RsiW